MGGIGIMDKLFSFLNNFIEITKKRKKVTVYNKQTGERLAVYSGKIKIQCDDKVTLWHNNKKVIIYNAIVIVD